jgi:uncharacterized membrane protein HdeD (DUF308 family)
VDLRQTMGGHTLTELAQVPGPVKSRRSFRTVKTKRRQRLLDFVAVLSGASAFATLIYDFIRSLANPASAFLVLLVGFPVLVAGLLLAIRYRRDIGAHRWQLLASVGAGAAGLYLILLPEKLGVRERFITHSKSWFALPLSIFVWLLFYLLVGLFIPWLYRQTRHAFTQFQDHYDDPDNH